MSVKYSIAERMNPRKPSEPKKFYAQSQAAGELTFDELCEDVAERCTVTKADIAASIEGVLISISHSLRKGEIVRFGQFGSFQVNLSSKGADTLKDFSAAMIKGGRIVFRPGKMLTTLTNNLEYAQVPKKVVKKKKGEATDVKDAAKDKNTKIGG